MPNFIFAYHGGKKPESPAEGEKVMAEWGAWFQKLGGAVADPGGPVGQSHTVSGKGVAENGGANPLSGYTLVKAKDHAAATAMARDCPMVKDGSGNVEVAEVLEM
jgi:hypothetical protein